MTPQRRLSEVSFFGSNIPCNSRKTKVNHTWYWNEVFQTILNRLKEPEKNHGFLTEWVNFPNKFEEKKYSLKWTNEYLIFI